MVAAQREAEAARQEAKEARTFEVELRSAAEKNLGQTAQVLIDFVLGFVLFCSLVVVVPSRGFVDSGVCMFC